MPTRQSPAPRFISCTLAAWHWGKRQEKLGATFSDILWTARGERLTEESFARLRRQGGQIVIFVNTEEMVRTALANPLAMIASDGGIVNGIGHPRGAGTYARTLGKYVRDEKVLSLMDD